MRILLIGCGNLGSALLRAWLLPHQEKNNVLIVQPSLSAQPLFPDFHFVKEAADVPKDFMPDISVIAIKPQKIQEVLPSYSSFLKHSLVISFAAGIPMTRLELFLEGNKRCLRVMPNVAMQIGRSVNLIYAAAHLSSKDRDLAASILKMSGALLWLKTEDLINALMPISASGPAYFFMLSEVLTHLALKSGLEEPLARQLVHETFLGSALLTSPTSDFKEMISSVASKGGVTEAALDVLSTQFLNLMQRAYEAAFERSKDLEK